jgi:hypothetical protein
MAFAIRNADGPLTLSTLNSAGMQPLSDSQDWEASLESSVRISEQAKRSAAELNPAQHLLLEQIQAAGHFLDDHDKFRDPTSKGCPSLG